MKNAAFAAALFAIIFLLSSCSLQENMSAEIFLERLADSDAALSVDFDERYYEKEKCICFVRDEGGTEYVISMSIAESGNVKCVEVASVATDKEKAFVGLVEMITEVYSPDDDVTAVIDGLFKNGTISDKCTYYATQWREYSSFGDENGLFFSIDNLRLCERSIPDLTLGDLSGYLNKSQTS